MVKEEVKKERDIGDRLMADQRASHQEELEQLRTRISTLETRLVEKNRNYLEECSQLKQVQFCRCVSTVQVYFKDVLSVYLYPISLHLLYTREINAEPFPHNQISVYYCRFLQCEAHMPHPFFQCVFSSFL